MIETHNPVYSVFHGTTVYFIDNIALCLANNFLIESRIVMNFLHSEVSFLANIPCFLMHHELLSENKVNTNLIVFYKYK